MADQNRPLRSQIFGQNVFDQSKMVQFLTNEALRKVHSASISGHQIDRRVADQVAEGMKAWALGLGATHYTHWFQPLTGATAEKHDAFFHLGEGGRPMEKFGGQQLVQQEPDASSFPSGGIRNTFEARGYTAWDPTSPAFVYRKTLCIPTVFVAYTGEALDYKTPLLRALSVLDESATEVMQYFDKNVKKVYATLGWEQEFFLIDSALANSRPDILVTGRTLIGASAAKGQQLDDHYFGVVPKRVLDYLTELEEQCLRLGIPLKTRHNEVAPNQFELAPIFEEANLSVDHNLLLMDIMDAIAVRHGFKVLFHEKPFAGVNGSGKHNNWSLRTDRGTNLLSPGTTPTKNLRFLTFFVNTIKAVDRYEELLCSSIASASNDHRLGAQEAPPPIMSIFIGGQLAQVLDELEGVSLGKLSPEEKTELKLNVVGKIPQILLDNTDRNRTSPFAFTGNKFEMRGVGAKMNCAKPMTILNTIVAHQLRDFKKEVDHLIDKKGLKKDEAIFNVLREYIKTSKRIRFDGDGYSTDWQKEAKKRKLSYNQNTPEALKILTEKDTLELFDTLGVYSEVEIRAHQNVELANYALNIQIEAGLISQLVQNHIFPACIEFQNTLLDNAQRSKEVMGKVNEVSKSMAQEITDRMAASQKLISQLNVETNAAMALGSEAKATHFANKVLPIFDGIRVEIDGLEKVMPDKDWPLAKYAQLLYGLKWN